MKELTAGGRSKSSLRFFDKSSKSPLSSFTRDSKEGKGAPVGFGSSKEEMNSSKPNGSEDCSENGSETCSENGSETCSENISGTPK